MKIDESKIPSRESLNDFVNYAHRVQKAHEAGKTILYKNLSGNWGVIKCPRWNWEEYLYAVAPEIVPFDSDDIKSDMWFRNKSDVKTLIHPFSVRNESLLMSRFYEITYPCLADLYEYTTDLVTFHPCHKVAK